MLQNYRLLSQYHTNSITTAAWQAEQRIFFFLKKRVIAYADDQQINLSSLFTLIYNSVSCEARSNKSSAKLSNCIEKSHQFNTDGFMIDR